MCAHTNKYTQIQNDKRDGPSCEPSSSVVTFPQRGPRAPMAIPALCKWRPGQPGDRAGGVYQSRYSLLQRESNGEKIAQ